MSNNTTSHELSIGLQPHDHEDSENILSNAESQGPYHHLQYSHPQNENFIPSNGHQRNNNYLPEDSISFLHTGNPNPQGLYDQWQCSNRQNECHIFPCANDPDPRSIWDAQRNGHILSENMVSFPRIGDPELQVSYNHWQCPHYLPADLLNFNGMASSGGQSLHSHTQDFDRGSYYHVTSSIPTRDDDAQEDMNAFTRHILTSPVT